MFVALFGVSTGKPQRNHSPTVVVNDCSKHSGALRVCHPISFMVDIPNHPLSRCR